MIMAVTIKPIEDRVLVSASAGERELRKQYSSMKAATTEAVELGIMLTRDKEIVDSSQPMPDYPHGFKTDADVDVAELVERGFRMIGRKS